MEEELGIRPLTQQFAYEYIHSNYFESELVSTYVCQHEGEITFNPEEIDSVKFRETKEIEDHLVQGILSDNFEEEFLRYQCGLFAVKSVWKTTSFLNYSCV